ncbi:uncharacterized protein [Halyomorpha halys]|uniref:uncharacterized protein n=1 Tax=Halyomorpha halys TaxID=286706 RepID=UPI0034D2B864
MIFLDFKQAYDCAGRKELLKAMVKVGIPKKLIRLVKMILMNSTCQVKFRNSLSQEFSVENGLRQGDPLAPLLFNIALEVAIRSIRTNPGGTIYNRLSQNLAYADDVVIASRTRAALKGTLQKFEEAASELDLKVDEDKTVYMKTSRKDKEENSKEMFRDLGSCRTVVS